MGPAAAPLYDTVIIWFRRDMRVDDNPALTAALQSARNVVPLFLWAPEEEGQFQPGRTSRWWTKQSVLDLQRQLTALGSSLVLRRSADRCKGLLQAVADVGAQAVFFNNLYDPISLVSDHEIKQALALKNVECKSFNADMLYEPWEVVGGEDNQPCTTFEEFWGRVTTKDYPPPLPLPAPVCMSPVDPSVPTETPNTIDWFMTKEQEAASDQLRFKWKPGVAGAVSKLEAFFAGKLPVFDHERAKVDRESTSELSPWIHIGSVSIRYIFYRTKQYELQSAAVGVDKTQSCADFLRQMGYREYARYLAFFFPFIHERSLLAHLRNCPWRLDQDAFKAWRQGQTGYPLVDAAMKQLWSTGWAHNRLRVVASSFAVKNLLLPWQWGLKHFWDAQLDADLENDALGWQYISGGMADAHPFSFIIDLSAECKRLDPDGEYVRRWLPALSLLPTQYIHAPWTAPAEVLEAADVELGVNYPKPIITIHESILSLQYAVEVLDSTSMAACSGGTTRHPYRQPHNPLPSHDPDASVYADPSLGAVAKSWATPGSTEATAFLFNYKSGSSSQPMSGSSLPGSTLRPSEGRHAMENATSAQPGTDRSVDGSLVKTGGGAFKPLEPKKVLLNTCPPVGFDYPKYRQTHSQHSGHYIDVRLVPPEAIKAAAAAAVAFAARGAVPPLKPIPGMRDEAVHIAAMVHQIRDSDSAWAAPNGAAHRGVDADGAPLSSCGGSEGECMSEEVVSNTVGLSAPQISGLSGFGRAASARGGAGKHLKRDREDAQEGNSSPMGSDFEEECGDSHCIRSSAQRNGASGLAAERALKIAKAWDRDNVEVTGDAQIPMMDVAVASGCAHLGEPEWAAAGQGKEGYAGQLEHS